MTSSTFFLKRLLYDIKIYENQKNEFNKLGIYLHYDIDDLREMKLLIIGTDKTPYKGGFYIFNINYPNNYPWHPPKLTFMTKSDNIRFHPNFYTEGYVCLSILNTWGTNEWSPCQTITAIASTIQSIMNDNPIINEPDFETETGTVSKNYIKILEYYNLKGAVYNQLYNNSYYMSKTELRIALYTCHLADIVLFMPRGR
jgi:ubiquitin-protein ligase